MIFFQRVNRILKLLPEAFREFNRNEPLRLAAATAFFTTFALPAILIILIQIFGLILDPQTISQHLFMNLSDVIGKNTVAQLRETLRNVRHLTSNLYIAAGVFVFLIFVSTTLFKVIRDSLNQLWNIKINKRKGIVLTLEHRARAFVVILLAGVLFVAVLLAEGLLALLRQYISDTLPDNALILNGLINQLISLIVVTAWFTVVFKFLPDGRVSWKVSLVGALFTGILFTGGKLILKWLLTYSNIHTIYGASTSMVLLLLFVFYCSFMFYYGACFTKVWALYTGQPIQPRRHAVKYRLSEVEME